MRLLAAGVLLVCFGAIVCPPVDPRKEKPTRRPPGGGQDATPIQDDVNLGLEYERYLKEVVNVLETDEAFKAKLEAANATDIKSGEIAKHLDLVDHNVRSKLDELKRAEIDRLRTLVRLKMKQAQAFSENLPPSKRGRPPPGIKNFDPRKFLNHLDPANPDTFEMKDLEINTTGHRRPGRHR